MPRISAACGNVASDLNLSRSRPPLRILLLLAICLWQSGCFELIRRRPSDGDAVTARLDAGNLGEGRNVQRDSATPSPDSTASSEAAPIDGDPETVSPSPRPSATLTVDPAAPLTTGAVTEDPEEPGGLAMADAVEQTLTEKRPRRTPERTEQERRRLAAAWAARTRKQREIVKQVNEYVLWCIENEMWKEARLHLEQATEQDSLAGSLYNNLGLVYERLGLPDKAEIAYERASDLNPAREAYRANLRRLHGRLEAVERAEPARLDSLIMELEELDVEPVHPPDGEPRNTLLPPFSRREAVGSITRKQVSVERK